MYSKFNINNADIIIIGAGLSGLSVAYQILKRDPTLNVIIFEAKDRIGGRIFSETIKLNEDNVIRCDLGGQFFSTHQTSLIDVLNELDIDFKESKHPVGHLLGVFKNKVRKSSTRPPTFSNFIVNNELEYFFFGLEQVSEKIQLHLTHDDSLNETYDNITMGQYIKRNLYFRSNRQYVKILIKSLYGVDVNDISVLCYCAYCHSLFGIINQTCMSEELRKFLIPEGACTICDKMANIIDKNNIYLNEPVIKIKQKDDCMLVKTNVGYYKCDFVIVAIPPTEILNVEFQPDLPIEQVDYFSRTSQGRAIKFFAVYEDDFWKKQNLCGELFMQNPSSPLISCFNIKLNQYPTICGFINPDYKSENELPIKLDVLKELAKYFGQEALNPIAYVEKDWSKEEYSGGCPINLPGMNMLKYTLEVYEHVGRIYWAGTETSSYCYGHMAGAVYSGYNTAIKILYRIRPQCLNIEDFKLLKPMPFWFRYYKTPGIHKYLNVKYIVPVALFSLILGIYIGRILRNH